MRPWLAADGLLSLPRPLWGAAARWERLNWRRWLGPAAAGHHSWLRAVPLHDRHCWVAAGVRAGLKPAQAEMPCPMPSLQAHVASAASRLISREQPVGVSRTPGGGPLPPPPRGEPRGGLLLLERPLGDRLRLL